MNQPEGDKVWYVTREGQQFGPVSMDDLKFEAERGELNPRLDMAWKDGMEEWIPAGQIEGLFKKDTAAEEAERLKNAPPVAAAQAGGKPSQGDIDDYFHESKEYTEGTSRGGYIFICYILPIILGVGFVFGSKFLEPAIGEKMMPIVVIVLALVYLVLAIAATLNRFLNLGMSRWWFFGLIVPFLNYWLGYRLFACPAGYKEHNRLGGAGWFLAVVYWLPLLAAVGFGVFAAVKGPEAMQSMMEDGLTKMGIDIKEFQKPATEETPDEPAPSPY
jgi:uncharacterized membrane protein YhaH (DUF805 family)